MLKEEVIHHHQDHHPLLMPTDYFSQDEILGTLSAQLLEYCESDSIQDTLPSSEGTLEPNCRSSDDPAKFCLTPDGDANDGSAEVVPPAGYNVDVVNTTISTIGDEDDGMASLSTIFDAREEEDISASIDFSTSPSVYAPHAHPPPEFLSNQSERYDFSGVQHRITSTEVTMNGMTHFTSNPAGSLGVTQLPYVVDVCLSSMPSCNFLTTNDMGMSFVHPNVNGANFCADASGMVIGSMLGINGELQAQDLDYCRGDGSGIFYHNSQPGIFNPGDMQAIGLESQKLLGGQPTSAVPLATEISNPDDGAATFKVGKLSPVERREKIDRYIRKRNERNFSKKIKYACRKTLADSRPRVRGRFAKNDEQGEASRHAFGNNGSDCHHEDDYDDEENPTSTTSTTTTTTEIFGHMNGLSSFNCSFPYPIMDLNGFSDNQLGTF